MADEQDVQPEEQDEPTEPEKDWKAEYEKVLAQSRKWEQRSKANADAAKRLAELEDSTKSDEEKLSDALKRAEEAESKVAEFERQAERAKLVERIASEHERVDAQLLARMTGDTEDEIEENARLLESKPVYPSVEDAGQRKAPQKKDAQKQFGDFFAEISRR